MAPILKFNDYADDKYVLFDLKACFIRKTQRFY